MSIQNMHYAARIRGVGEKFVNAVKDEDLLGAKGIVETALFLNAGEEVKNSVEGATQRSAVNSDGPVNEDWRTRMFGQGPANKPTMGGSPAMPQGQQLDPATVSAMMQMFQQMMAAQQTQQPQAPRPGAPGAGMQARMPRPNMGGMPRPNMGGGQQNRIDPNGGGPPPTDGEDYGDWLQPYKVKDKWGRPRPVLGNPANVPNGGTYWNPNWGYGIRGQYEPTFGPRG